MALIKVVCPACDGTGAGSGLLGVRGRSGGYLDGACNYCRAEGEVSPEKRERFLARKLTEER